MNHLSSYDKATLSLPCGSLLLVNLGDIASAMDSNQHNETSLIDLIRRAARENCVISGELCVPPEFRPLAIGPYEFDIVTEASALEEIFTLRQLAYFREGLTEYSDRLTHVAVDRFDLSSAIFVARDTRSRQVVATSRVIFNRESGLQCENAFDVASLRTPTSIVAESSRLAVAIKGLTVEHRGSALRLSEVVLHRGTEFAFRRGITHLIGVARKKLQHFYLRNRFLPVDQEIRRSWISEMDLPSDEEMYPTLLDIRQFFCESAHPYVDLISN
ncbi:MAG: GNAT family N-acetyltransferase [Acidobacteria bacterium]|nr:GNAT family N-acetyltransferase [Acidobacteriota bacterium]